VCVVIIIFSFSKFTYSLLKLTVNIFNYRGYHEKGVVRNDKAYISCSETVLINHPFYGYVYNYVKLRIYEDDSVEIIAQYVDPQTYEIKMDEKFLTIFNNGTNEGGIYFYK